MILFHCAARAEPCESSKSLVPLASIRLRKQREVRQRETALLAVARKMLVEQGYAGLSMDRLAEATEYSRGTIYQHFSTKEDLITALSVERSEQRLALMAKVRTFQGRPREKILALGVADELFARLHPHYFRSELIIRMADLESRASAERRETMAWQDRCLADWAREIVQQAIEAGDLPGASAATAGDVAFSLFSLAVGTHLCVVNFPHIVEQLRVVSPQSTLKDGDQALLDGFGWRPLRSEWDYGLAHDGIVREVFADEYRRAGLA